MAERSIECGGVFVSQQIEPSCAAPAERLCHETTADALPAVRAIDDDQRQMRLDHAVDLYRRDTDEPDRPRSPRRSSPLEQSAPDA
jgi:hypothetical protein